MASVRPVVAGGSARNARQAAVCCLTKQDFRQLRNLFEAINISATGELSLDELLAFAYDLPQALLDRHLASSFAARDDEHDTSLLAASTFDASEARLGEDGVLRLDRDRAVTLESGTSADERVAFVERAVFVSLVVVALVLVRHSDV